ncbi:MAG: translation elongation factor Ts, partial [Lacrimispora sphenoides]
MAAVTAGMVKELREMTGAGMMDCKKALAETDGDMDKAVEFLREKGLAAASKKAGRIAAEGIVTTVVSEDGKSAAIVEVNSETDFVAKNAQFQTYVADVATQVLTSQATDMEGFLAETWTQDNSLTVAQALSSQIAVIGENMNIRRYEKIVTEGVVVDYIHGGGRIGVL